MNPRDIDLHDIAALLATPALDFHLSPRRAGLAPVNITHARLSVAVSGNQARRSCVFSERYDGVNHSPYYLPSFDLKVDADFYTPARETHIELFDLLRDPNRHMPIPPLHTEESPYQKWLALPFADPGVPPRGPFSVELRYSYSGVVSAHLDYWFMDPYAHSSAVGDLTFVADWQGTDLRHALHMAIDRVSKAKQLVGRLDIVRTDASCHVECVCKPDPTRVDLFVLGTGDP